MLCHSILIIWKKQYPAQPQMFQYSISSVKVPIKNQGKATGRREKYEIRSRVEHKAAIYRTDARTVPSERTRRKEGMGMITIFSRQALIISPLGYRPLFLLYGAMQLKPAPNIQIRSHACSLM